MKIRSTITLISVSAVILLVSGVLATQAATADISNLVFVNQPSDDLEQNETGHFTIEARDDAGNAEPADTPADISLDDGGRGGIFFQYSNGACTDTELSNNEVTIASGESQADFCYQNSSDGDYRIQAALNGVGGNYAAGDTYGAENVWTNGYEAVWHMGEDPSGSGRVITDSTSNGYGGNPGTSAMTSSDSVAGQLSGNALDFDGVDDDLDTGDSTVTGDITVSLWQNHDSLPAGGSEQVAITGRFDGANTAWELKTPGASGSSNGDTNFRFQSFDGTGHGVEVPQSNFSEDTWNYLTGTCGAGQWKLYNNGVDLNGTTYSQGTCAVASDSDRRIGGVAVSGAYFDGTLDEIRLATTSRSANWIASEYTNQNTPTSFYTAGLAETGSGAGWYDATWDKRIPVTIQSSEVDSQLTDFPVYVDLADLGSDFFSGAAANCGDIRVTTSDGTSEVAREVVSCDTDTETGELHFKADSISNTTDTTFYMYYEAGIATVDLAVVISPGGVGDRLHPRKEGEGPEFGNSSDADNSDRQDLQPRPRGEGFVSGNDADPDDANSRSDSLQQRGSVSDEEESGSGLKQRDSAGTDEEARIEAAAAEDVAAQEEFEDELVEPKPPATVADDPLEKPENDTLPLQLQLNEAENTRLNRLLRSALQKLRMLQELQAN